MKAYKGYTAAVLWYEEDNLYCGTLNGISDMVTFHGRTMTELEKHFEAAVDDYLAFCKEISKTPEKPENNGGCMSGIRVNGIKYWFSEEKMPEIKDILDSNACVVYEEGHRPIDLPNTMTEIHVDGIVYVFEEAEDIMDKLDFSADRVEEE